MAQRKGASHATSNVLLGSTISVKKALKGEEGIPGWLSGLGPAFGPGCDPGIPGSSPTSGSLRGACFSLLLGLCLSLSLCLS